MSMACKPARARHPSPAALGGKGRLGGNVTIQSGGTLAPGGAGAVAGTLTIDGDLTLQGGSLLSYALGQAGVAGGALNDLTNVGGNLALGGTLNVSTSTGGTFGPGVYRLFNYGGTHSGSLTLGTMSVSGNYFIQTSVDKQVNLVNADGLTLNWDGDAGPEQRPDRWRFRHLEGRRRGNQRQLGEYHRHGQRGLEPGCVRRIHRTGRQRESGQLHRPPGPGHAVCRGRLCPGQQRRDGRVDVDGRGRIRRRTERGGSPRRRRLCRRRRLRPMSPPRWWARPGWSRPTWAR